MPVWRTRNVQEQPEIRLVRWQIHQIIGGPLTGELHLIGYNEDDLEGRVSTALVKIDKKARRCETKSGRVYHLVGASGSDPDAQYIWLLWVKANRVPAEKDISMQFQFATE